MARCPYAPHRLVSQGGTCKRCAGDIRLYTALQGIPVSLYNSARRLCATGNYAAAAALAVEALKLRPEFPEAHWLLASLYAGAGQHDAARACLLEAARLGAAVSFSWLEEAPLPAPVADEAPIPPDAAIC